SCGGCGGLLFLFFFQLPAPSEIYTLSLHDALPILKTGSSLCCRGRRISRIAACCAPGRAPGTDAGSSPKRTPGSASSPSAMNRRSEEHTSELQSLAYLVCRLLLEKKKKQHNTQHQ